VKNGRISMPGINTKNVQYLAEAMKDALVNVK
jgi:aspartate/tyrosine/aromatic aminotransferase